MIKHALKQPFILTTGLAAFVHSTWALSTLFTGYGPSITDWQTLLSWLWWILPGALIAFALDVGQIATSAELREGDRSPAKYATFGIFAFATYILQWLYMAHHMPALDLSAGVREQWLPMAQLLRDASLWIIPAFLPLSTIAYTFSSRHTETPIEEIPAETKALVTVPPEEAIVITVPKSSTRTLHQSGNGNGHHDPDRDPNLDIAWNVENPS
jgi:hypothetical protein